MPLHGWPSWQSWRVSIRWCRIPLSCRAERKWGCHLCMHRSSGGVDQRQRGVRLKWMEETNFSSDRYFLYQGRFYLELHVVSFGVCVKIEKWFGLFQWWFWFWAGESRFLWSSQWCHRETFREVWRYPIVLWWNLVLYFIAYHLKIDNGACWFSH